MFFLILWHTLRIPSHYVHTLAHTRNCWKFHTFQGDKLFLFHSSQHPTFVWSPRKSSSSYIQRRFARISTHTFSPTTNKRKRPSESTPLGSRYGEMMIFFFFGCCGCCCGCYFRLAGCNMIMDVQTNSEARPRHNRRTPDWRTLFRQHIQQRTDSEARRANPNPNVGKTPLPAERKNERKSGKLSRSFSACAWNSSRTAVWDSRVRSRVSYSPS